MDTTHRSQGRYGPSGKRWEPATMGPVRWLCSSLPCHLPKLLLCCCPSSSSPPKKNHPPTCSYDPRSCLVVVIRWFDQVVVRTRSGTDHNPLIINMSNAGYQNSASLWLSMAHCRNCMPISPLAQASMTRLLMLTRLPHGPDQPRRAATQENAGAGPPSGSGFPEPRRDLAGQPLPKVSSTHQRRSANFWHTD